MRRAKRTLEPASTATPPKRSSALTEGKTSAQNTPQPCFTPLTTTFATANTLAAFSQHATQSSESKISLSSIAKSFTDDSIETILERAQCCTVLVPHLMTLVFDPTEEASLAAWSIEFMSPVATAKLKKPKKSPAALNVKKMQHVIQSRLAVFQTAMDRFIGEQVGLGKDAYSVLLDRVGQKYGSASMRSLKVSELEGRQKVDVAGFLARIKEEAFYMGQIEREESWKVVPSRIAVFGSLNTPLSNELVSALLEANEVASLYSHQAEAINAIEQGRNVIVSTSTASGKSLIYQIPVMRELENNIDARAMFIFPTKALAQDQKRSLSDLISHHASLSHHMYENEYFISAYDGDTPTSSFSGPRSNTPSVRDAIRDTSRVLFTNFDTLHKAFLWHKYWIPFFRQLKIVVVDGE
ncbi:hypothetical protein HDU98_003955 [Podochytrium sp. JEL0797]|nr:hypothetical protein HDU98_003955 [Podochytrium sp. JEL0797]